MVIEDFNNVPVFIDIKSIICVKLESIQEPDSENELSLNDRYKYTLYRVSFYLPFNLNIEMSFTRKQYEDLWERLKNEF